MSKTLGSLPNGALVKDTGTLYYGKPIVWKIADKGHTGYPSGSVTLITEKIITLKCVDAIEAGNSDGNRRSYGNNRYSLSNIDRWLNSDAAAGKWWAATHSADAAPTNANVWSGYNEYDAQAGFLNGFSTNMKAALLSTTITVAKNTVTDGGGSETITRKMFLASTTEVGLANENNIAEGSKLAIFSDNNSRLAYPTAEAVKNSEYTNSSLAAGKPWWWYLRTPYASYSCSVRCVLTVGTLGSHYAYSGGVGVRPLCNLKSEILVSDNTDSDGAYTIIWNQPPTIPGSLTMPDTVEGGKTATITWGQSTDPEGNLSGYVLERSTNGGTYAQVYKGLNRSYIDTIQFGWDTVQYRVKAYDGAGLESGYYTGTKKGVVNNHPPVISGTDSDLGTKSGPFSQSYTITDEDSAQTITATEKIDGTVKRSFTAGNGTQYTFTITQEDWMKIQNGSHTLTVEAKDSAGGTAARTWQFAKRETELEFMLSAPLPADDMLTKAIMSVTRQIPAGAELKVYACNNAFDAAPTWEDVTQAVNTGNKFFLSNTTKTAESWGFNFKISVKRKDATGDCYIQSVGGNFE